MERLSESRSCKMGGNLLHMDVYLFHIFLCGIRCGRIIERKGCVRDEIWRKGFISENAGWFEDHLAGFEGGGCFVCSLSRDKCHNFVPGILNRIHMQHLYMEKQHCFIVTIDKYAYTKNIMKQKYS